MKKTLIALATFSALAGLTSVASAQSNITVYGVIDEALRTSSHANEKGERLNEVTNGVQSESRLGFKGSEDLGNGLKAVFQVESGFSAGDGVSNDGRLFGRTALVGISHNTYGTLTLGRQNSLGYDFAMGTDVYNVANNLAISGYQAALTGFRWDNSVKYVNTMGNFNVGAQISSGNKAGSNSSNSAYAVTGGYKYNALNLQALYQQANDTQDGVLGSLAGEKQKLAAVGATYDFGKTQLFGQYFRNTYNVSDQANDIYVVGAAYALAPKVTLKGSATYDKQKNVNAGHRSTYSTLVSYNFSKRTDVYAEVDYNKFSGEYRNTVYDLNTAANPNNNSTGVTVGLRHSF